MVKVAIDNFLSSSNKKAKFWKGTMSTSMRPSFLMLILGILCLGVESKTKSRPERPSIDVGRFHIDINDDRFKFDQIIANKTLVQELDSLWYDTFDYWGSYDEDESPPSLVQSRTSADFASNKLLGSDSKYAKWLNDTTYYWITKDRYSFDVTPEDHKYYDYSYYYMEAIWYLTRWVDWYRLAAYTGVGKTVTCSFEINQVLSDLPEWEKAGSNAAITVMALLPTFLAFGNLYVPRSSEAFATSTLVGMSCAVYSLGIPVKSISAIPGKNHIYLRLFTLGALATLASFSTLKPTPSRAGRKARKPPTLEELQSWSDEEQPEEPKQCFSQIRDEVDNWKRRWHWWHTPAIIVASIQLVMFGIAVAPLLFTLGAPRFLFNCGRNWTGWYLGASASINAFFRLLMWETGYHESVRIYALSDNAKLELTRLIERTADPSDPRKLTTERQLPPLYPPLLERIMSFWHSSLAVLHLRKPRASDSRVHDVAAVSRSIRGKWQSRISYVSRNPRGFLNSGFKENPSARRYRPVIVLLHLSTEGRMKLITIFTGFVEAMLLLILTFFFAAQWGGNLYVTGIALILLLVFITAGRAIGVLYVMFSSKVWGLHVVHCDSHEEILGSMRIICSMTGVLVVVNGASYFDGYRLDGRPKVNDEPGFDEWRRRYEDGDYDDPLDDPVVRRRKESVDTEGGIQLAPNAVAPSTVSSTAPISTHSDDQPLTDTAANDDAGLTRRPGFFHRDSENTTSTSALLGRVAPPARVYPINEDPQDPPEEPQLWRKDFAVSPTSPTAGEQEQRRDSENTTSGATLRNSQSFLGRLDNLGNGLEGYELTMPSEETRRSSTFPMARRPQTHQQP